MDTTPTDQLRRYSVAERNAYRRDVRRYMRLLVSRRKHAAALVLQAIIDQLDRTLRFTVSAEALMQYTGLSRQSLFEALDYLDAQGILGRQRGRTMNTYRVRAENLWMTDTDSQGDPDSVHRQGVPDSVFVPD